MMRSPNMAGLEVFPFILGHFPVLALAVDRSDHDISGYQDAGNGPYGPKLEDVFPLFAHGAAT